MPDPNAAGRIAIRFGAGTKPSSSSSSPSANKKPQPPSSTLGKRARPSAFDRAGTKGSNKKNGFGDDDDSESGDDDDDAPSRHEVITGFGADGAENSERKEEEKKEFVIARQPNRDWRADVKKRNASSHNNRRGGRLPDEATRSDQPAEGTQGAETNGEGDIRWGLTVKKRKLSPSPPAPPSGEGREGGGEYAPAISERKKPVGTDPSRDQDSDPNPNPNEEQEGTNKPAEDDDDKRALNALLGRSPSPSTQAIIRPSEEDAYKRAVSAAGEAPTLEDYEAMPVEEFGAALLRGMGWDGKKGPAPKEVRRRPNRLGLGAKELDGKEDLGGWGQKSGGGGGGSGGNKGRRPRLDEYRREEQKRKDRRRDAGGGGGERDRERDRDRDRDRDRGGRDGHRGYDDRRRDRHRDDRDRRR